MIESTTAAAEVTSDSATGVVTNPLSVCAVTGRGRRTAAKLKRVFWSNTLTNFFWVLKLAPIKPNPSSSRYLTS